MFYSVDILCRKDSQFSAVWLAAMHLKKMKRRQVESVDIVKTCDTLMRSLPKADALRSERKQRKIFSLYLASQLMYGTIVLFDKQHKYLLDDLKEIIDKVKRLMTVSSSIDMVNPIGRNIDMPDPLETLRADPFFFENFGRPDFRMSQSPVILDFNQQDYVTVHTARSDRSESTVGAQFRHLARRADITMPEDDWGSTPPRPMMDDELPPPERDVFPSDTGMEAVDVLINDDLIPPAESPLQRDQMMEEPIQTEPIVTSASPAEETMFHPFGDGLMAPPPLPARRLIPEPDDVTFARPAEPRPRPRREPPITFTLEPLGPEEIERESPRGRPQIRRTVRAMDRQCVISGDGMNRQINDFTTNMRQGRPIIDLRKLRRAQENLLEMPALGGAGTAIRELFELNMVSRKVPGTFEDIFRSPPWTIRPDSDLGTPDLLQPFLPPPMEEEQFMDMPPPPEEPIAMDFGVSAPSEISSMEAGRQMKESFPDRNVTPAMATGTATGGRTTLENIMEEPYPEEMPPQEEPASKRQRVRSPAPIDHLARCYPPAPDMPTAQPQTFQLHDEQLINQVNEMIAGGRTITFEELCPPETTTKAQAAKTFYKLLELKKARVGIVTKQVEAYGSIAISR